MNKNKPVNDNHHTNAVTNFYITKSIIDDTKDSFTDFEFERKDEIEYTRLNTENVNDIRKMNEWIIPSIPNISPGNFHAVCDELPLDFIKKLMDSKKYNNPVLVNPICDHVALGNWEQSYYTSETDLCIRSTIGLFWSHPDIRKYWPLQKYQHVYLPKIEIFKDAEWNTLPWSQCWQVSCLLLSPITDKNIYTKNNDLLHGSAKIVRQAILKAYRIKINAIFQEAIKHKHDAIVMPFLGFKLTDPQNEYAQVIMDVWSEYMYSGIKGFFIMFCDNKWNPNIFKIDMDE